MTKLINLSKKDNVAITSEDIPKDTLVRNNQIRTKTIIPKDHKIAIKGILKGEKILKYGQIIGKASNNIEAGEHVHNHNMTFIEFERNIFEQSVSNIKLKNNSYSRTFLGYERKNGKVGTRNYIGLVSTVNCSATVVKLIANKINDYLNQNTFNNIEFVLWGVPLLLL